MTSSVSCPRPSAAFSLLAMSMLRIYSVSSGSAGTTISGKGFASLLAPALGSSLRSRRLVNPPLNGNVFYSTGSSLPAISLTRIGRRGRTGSARYVLAFTPEKAEDVAERRQVAEMPIRLLRRAPVQMTLIKLDVR